MKEKLILIGTGPNAKRAYDFICHHDLFDVQGFAVNEEYKTADTFLGLPVYSIESMDSVIDKTEIKIFVALLWNNLNADRKKLYTELKEKGYQFANLISPLSAVYSDRIGENCWINDFAVVLNDAVIGNDVDIMEFVTVGDNANISNHCFLGGKSTIASDCTIGEQSFVGLGCIVFDGTMIGDKCILGAGTAIKRNMPDYSVCKTKSDYVVCQYDEKSIEEKLVASKNIR